MIRVTLPYPDAKLNPNARPNIFQRARLIKLARHEAKILTMAALGLKGTCQLFDRKTGRVPVRVEIAPPDRRKTRDLQNAIGALKAAMDGVQDGLKIDDSLFAIRWPETFSAPVKGGQVILTIGEG